jgi:hypothetical protein
MNKTADILLAIAIVAGSLYLSKKRTKYTRYEAITTDGRLYILEGPEKLEAFRKLNKPIKSFRALN